jgi:lysophospholipase L1-like esterase
MRRHFIVLACVLIPWLSAPTIAAAQAPAPQMPAPVTPGAPLPSAPLPSAPLQIQPPELSPNLRIVWEVKNRFRLFRREADFAKHLAAESLKTVLAAEQLMATETDGRGWARSMLANLCIDPMGGVLQTCERDGTRESYLAPTDHRVEMRLVGAPPQTTCAWLFIEGDAQPRNYTGPCSEEVRIRLGYGRPTSVTVDVSVPNGPPQRTVADIAVRDLLIAGLGDSIAAGEGNPDRPVVLSDEGFCFRRFGTGSEYYRPGRAGFKGDRSCESGRGQSETADWSRLGARWLSQACHRSLYGYQLRTALALAVENPHVAVTFLPLACTGATIETGVLGTQRARELNCTPDKSCPTTVPAQITQLQQYLTTARRGRAGRTLDMVLLTVGANDIDFSGLVANVIIDQTSERVLFGRSVIGSVENAEAALTTKLPANFARLRAALKPMVGGDLARVVFVSYGHPAMRSDGTPCGGGQAGFDVHPSFRLDNARLRQVADFVGLRFLPVLKSIVQCTGGTMCANPDTDRMTFVEAHQAAFAGHGICARSEQDPDFDRACFMADGKTFAANSVEGATDPLTCGQPASDFRAYTPRARWVRTANDSYFVAMTYPEGLPLTQQPTDIHDATWGVVSAVYGGAVHPTAEGHAAMADAALVAARGVLGLGNGTPSVSSEPLAPPAQ